VRSVVGWVGRVLLTAGILLLLFVAYQLWGTGIYEARAQSQLRDDLHQSLRQASPSTPSTSSTNGATTTSPGADNPTVSSSAAPTTTTLPPAPTPSDGDGMAFIRIPKIGLDTRDPLVVVEGVDVNDLQKGPGHYPGTPFPGQEGNTAIAGHRTTYGHPFGDLDQLGKGDEITLQTVQGTFTYTVSRGPFAVDPTDVQVLDPIPDPDRPGHNLATLTLTTCNPKYSAAQRLIVQADLEIPVGTLPLAASAPTSRVKVKISGLSGDSSSRVPALIWGLIVAVMGCAWWFAFHRYRRWYVWFAGAIPFLVVLFFFYTYLERLLPANY
jgi:sortase A